MNQVIGKYVGKFIPYPRQERVIRIPEIVYRMEEYKELSGAYQEFCVWAGLLSKS